LPKNIVPKGRQIISPGRKSWVAVQRRQNARPEGRASGRRFPAIPGGKNGVPGLPAFSWQEAGDFDFPFTFHQKSNFPRFVWVGHSCPTRGLLVCGVESGLRLGLRPRGPIDLICYPGLRPGLIIWRPFGTSIIRPLVIRALEFGVEVGLLPLLPKAGGSGPPGHLTSKYRSVY